MVAPATTAAATHVYESINPATGEVLETRPSLDRSGAEPLLAAAHEAFLSWRNVSVAEKVRLFSAAADVIDAHADELGRQIALEMGKIASHGAAEAGLGAGMFRYYAKHAAELLADEVVEVPGFSKSYVRREPLGVVLGIEPWNAPVYQALRAAVPNLMVGNTVLVKPARITAGSTLLLDALLIEAGFPAGVYQTALVSTDAALELIADHRIRAVTLTGSDRAGSIIGAQASKYIKPVVLELGGSDAFVVLDSADVDKAAATAAMCRLIISGQACALPKRVIVTDAVADEFTAKYSEVFANQTPGDPFDAATTLGPMSSEDAAATLQAQYQDAIDKGATVLVEGGRIDGPGYFFKPVVLTDLTPEMRVWNEESFGPLGLIFRVQDADAAVEMANSSIYGLGGTVFAEDLDEARRVAGQLDTGGVGINAFMGAPTEVPFGGTKSSGVGRELGRSGLEQFSNVKSYVYE